MDRRQFLYTSASGVFGLGLLVQSGCRTGQTAEVMKPGDKQLVGSNAAGQETYGPMVDQSVSALLGRHCQGIQQAGYMQGAPTNGPMRICFIGVENKSAEEMGDFKEQLYEQIDQRILHSGVYQSVSRKFVEAGLRQCRLRPDELLIPQNMRMFTGMMEQMQQPFDFALYCTLTSGTTRSNADYQRNYLLTLEMINVHNGQYDKESCEIAKKYNVSTMAKIKSWNPFG